MVLLPAMLASTLLLRMPTAAEPATPATAPTAMPTATVPMVPPILASTVTLPLLPVVMITSPPVLTLARTVSAISL